MNHRMLVALAVALAGSLAACDPADPTLPANASATLTSEDGYVLHRVRTAGFDELAGALELDTDAAAEIAGLRDAGVEFRDLDHLSTLLDAARPLAANTAMCTYYQQKAGYYQIRALQCAYSICYAMSPWYGYWANYYSLLARSVCPAA